ncbi:MAG: hypothetical protein EHM90_06950, partial [Chloroflexi bacterium]
MISATTATWLNYATTIVFQILFAAQFGSSGAAGAFVIAFAVAVSLGGVFVTTTITNVMPRMLGEEGALASSALRVLAILGALVVGSALALWVVAGPLANVIAPLIGVGVALMSTLLALSALFLASLGLSGIFGSVALIRGHRFLPALAPAFPSTLGALYLLSVDEPGVTGAFAAIAFGGAIQVLVLGAVAVFPRFVVTGGTPLQIGRLASLTAALLLLIGLLAPLQRILAASIDPAGAAQFDYAARSIQVALQLLLGGLVIAVLPDWTAKHNRAQDIRPEVINTMVAAVLLLITAGGIALVAASPIVSLVYERGAFVTSDTESVVLLVRILVPGFVAEGVWLVLAQALLATGRTDVVLRVWAVRFLTQLLLTLVLGLPGGAVGVAAAYSVSTVISTGAATRFATSLGILHGGASLIGRASQAGLAIALAA